MGFETKTFFQFYFGWRIWSIPMGFETEWQGESFSKSLDLKYPYGIWNWSTARPKRQAKAFEVSLWDLKLPQDFTVRKAVKIWSIPMGFETLVPFSTKKGGKNLKYPYGIWNTKMIMRFHQMGKNLKYPYGIWNNIYNKVEICWRSIWSIPMGFETSRNFGWNGRCMPIWSIPMGFETWRSTRKHFWMGRFEVSLWDLKPLTGGLDCMSVEIWSIPMGFETISKWWWKAYWFHLKYPYGIWNLSFFWELQLSLRFEVSLWDLKQPARPPAHPAPQIWSIPMGFETCHVFSPFLFFSIWSIPMGFETWKMGYWRDGKRRFEVSLWDLKLDVDHVEVADISIWSIPMGFETFPRFYCLLDSKNLKYPYGIWNRSRRNRSNRRLLIWSIPMGFETAASASSFSFNLDLKYPYGIWNIPCLIRFYR